MKRYVKLRITVFIAFLAIFNTSILAPLAPCFASVSEESCPTSAVQETMDKNGHEGHGKMPALSPDAADHHETMAGGHCGMMMDEDEEEFPTVPSGHQCTHHTASSKGSDVPSLYCNCHNHSPDSAVNASQQETRYLESTVAAALPVAFCSSAEPFENVLISNFHPDPIEKPPTFA